MGLGSDESRCDASTSTLTEFWMDPVAIESMPYVDLVAMARTHAHLSSHLGSDCGRDRRISRHRAKFANVGVLLGTNFHHRHPAVHNQSSHSGMATVRRNCPRRRTGRADRNVCAFELAGLRRRTFCLWDTQFTASYRNGVPLRRNRHEHSSTHCSRSLTVGGGYAQIY